MAGKRFCWANLSHLTALILSTDALRRSGAKTSGWLGAPQASHATHKEDRGGLVPIKEGWPSEPTWGGSMWFCHPGQGPVQEIRDKSTL